MRSLIDFLRAHATFANVVSLIALFVALGGTSYAALKISGSQLKNRSVSGKKLKRNTVGGREVRESRLRRVRRARRADRLGRYSARQLRLRCPANTHADSGVCFETAPRQALVYGIARIQCGSINRRLPTYEELSNAAASLGLAPGGELTGSVYLSGASLRVVTVQNEAGGAGGVPDTPAGERPFRCVAYPSNG